MKGVSSSLLGASEEGLKFLTVSPTARKLVAKVASGIPLVGGIISFGIEEFGETISRTASHVADRAKDFVIDKRVSSLQETASALQNSQSLLNGQISELQSGLAEAKDRELELSQAQSQLQ